MPSNLLHGRFEGDLFVIGDLFVGHDFLSSLADTEQPIILEDATRARILLPAYFVVQAVLDLFRLAGQAVRRRVLVDVTRYRERLKYTPHGC